MNYGTVEGREGEGGEGVVMGVIIFLFQSLEIKFFSLRGRQKLKLSQGMKKIEKLSKFLG